MNIFSDEMRRNPYPAYEQIRRTSPVLQEPESGIWMIFDYEGVKRVLTDQDTFSSRHGPDWLIFNDPPRHTKLRALISQAFTPRSVMSLEPLIGELSRTLLDRIIPRGEMDLADGYSVPLPIMVIAKMLGIPFQDLPQFKKWSDVILAMSYTVPGGPGAAKATSDF